MLTHPHESSSGRVVALENDASLQRRTDGDGDSPRRSSRLRQSSSARKRRSKRKATTTTLTPPRLERSRTIRPQVTPPSPAGPIRFSTSGSHMRHRWIFDVGTRVDDRSEGLSGASPSSSVPTWTHDDFDIVVGDERNPHHHHQCVLGRGRFGVVFLATELTATTAAGRRQERRQVALKRFDKYELADKTNGTLMVQREVELHARLQHKHIVQFFGYFHSADHVVLVLEYANQASLQHYLQRQNDGRLSVDQAAVMVHQVTSAVAYLAQQNVAHRDIKLENILVSSSVHDENDDDDDDEEETPPRAMLADFGWATHMPAPHQAWRKTFCGTPYIVPPEMLRRDKPYNALCVDPWALGLLAYHLVMGQAVFDERNGSCSCSFSLSTSTYCRSIFKQISGFGRLVPPLFVNILDKYGDWFDFCEALVQPNPEERLTAANALEHAWLRGGGRANQEDVRKERQEDKENTSCRVKQVRRNQAVEVQV